MYTGFNGNIFYLNGHICRLSRLNISRVNNNNYNIRATMPLTCEIANHVTEVMQSLRSKKALHNTYCEFPDTMYSNLQPIKLQLEVKHTNTIELVIDFIGEYKRIDRQSPFTVPPIPAERLLRWDSATCYVQKDGKKVCDGEIVRSCVITKTLLGTYCDIDVIGTDTEMFSINHLYDIHLGYTLRTPDDEHAWKLIAKDVLIKQAEIDITPNSILTTKSSLSTN